MKVFEVSLRQIFMKTTRNLTIEIQNFFHNGTAFMQKRYIQIWSRIHTNSIISHPDPCHMTSGAGCTIQALYPKFPHTD